MTELTVIESVVVIIIVPVAGFVFVGLVHFLLHWYMLRKTEEINDILNDIKKEKDI